MKSHDPIEFKKETTDKAITIWLPEEDKALYDLLRSEYDVKVQKEMRKAVQTRLEYLRAHVIKKSVG